jgi:mono/diheme cytochrome c family protein
MNTPNDPIRARENPDPHESNVPIPWAVIAITTVLLVWALVYIARSHSNDDVTLGDTRTTNALKETNKEATAATSAPLDGAAIFQARCMACHQGSGAGIPGVFPPLAGSSWLLTKPEIAVQIVLHGVQGPLTVNGIRYNGIMPVFKDILSDAEIAAVLSYARSSWGNGGALISSEQVAAERQATRSRTQPFAGDTQLQALLP